MRRRLFNFAAVASAVLFAAVLAAWVRSYWTADLWAYQGDVSKPTELWAAQWNCGILLLHRGGTGGAVPSHFRQPASRWSPDASAPWPWRLGFRYIAGRVGSDMLRSLYLPFWLPTGLAAVLPAAWLWRAIRRRRQRSRPGFAPIIPPPQDPDYAPG